MIMGFPMSTQTTTMPGVVLPGNSTVAFKEYPIPEPGHGQVLVRMKASSICGSDIRAIYREHLGKGPEGYQGVIAGHEPCGQIVKVGPGCKRFQAGDRVVIYHISGCGVCDECQHGYMISCRSDSRAAYGWQRDGGHAPYLLAEENTCIRLPDSLSFIDGAFCACGFGTAYEALRRMQDQRSGPVADHRSGAGRTGRGDAWTGAWGDDDPGHGYFGEPTRLGQRPRTRRSPHQSRRPSPRENPRQDRRATVARPASTVLAQHRHVCWPCKGPATGAGALMSVREEPSASRSPST